MNLKNRVVYIAGPITGRLDTYKQEFAEAEKHLADQGAVVLNPAVLPLGLKSHQSYMNICLPMLREADVLVLLPGWRHSKGAMAEFNEAINLGVITTVYHPDDMGGLQRPEPANDNVPASEDDLTWLARNVHQWKRQEAKTISRDVKEGIAKYGDGMPFAKFTRCQWLARRAELQHKPGWDDAPEWAQWLAQHDSGYWGWGSGVASVTEHTWTADAPGPRFIGKMQWSGCAGEVLGDWRDTLERRPAYQSELAEVDTEYLMRAAGYNRLRDACRIMRDRPDDCSTEAVDALYKLSRELLMERDVLPGDLSSKALVAVSAVHLLRTEPDMFSANELADLHQLCDAELTKRDAAVCGGQKYLDAHWFERGELPPVGAVCQFFSGGYDSDWFDWCIFHGLASCGGFIVEHHHRTSPERVTVALFDPALTKFRHIRTEQGKAATDV